MILKWFENNNPKNLPIIQKIVMKTNAFSHFHLIFVLFFVNFFNAQKILADNSIILANLIPKEKVETMVFDELIKYYGVDNFVRSLIHYKYRPNSSLKDIHKTRLFRNTDLVIRFNSENIQRLFQEGVLNHHETNTSGGLGEASKRLEIESRLLGLDINYLKEKYAHNHSLITKLLHKYGFLRPIDSRSDIAMGTAANHYGDVELILHEDLKYRSTVTEGDSLMHEIGRFGNGDGRKIQPKHVSDISMSDEIYLARGNHLSDQRKFVPISGSLYFEAQIFGKIEIEDIKEIRINKLKLYDQYQKQFKKLGFATYKIMMATIVPNVKKLNFGMMVSSLEMQKIPQRAAVNFLHLC
jgi:hypothetical protein